MTDRTDKNRVIIFDTTLRDGEQSPGASMNLDEKLRIAVTLEEMGVDVIEAGFPIASNGDFEAVKTIAAQIEKCQVAGLAAVGRHEDRECLQTSLAAAVQRGAAHGGGKVGALLHGRARVVVMGQPMQVREPRPAEHVLDRGASELTPEQMHQLVFPIRPGCEVRVAAL